MLATLMNELMVTQNREIHTEMIEILFQALQDFLIHVSYIDSQNSQKQIYYKNTINLRGGGCGQSKVDCVIDKKVKADQNLMISSSLPDNYRTNLSDTLTIIVEGAKFIGDPTKRNELLMKVQWFIHNREHLNYFCIDQKETDKIYELVQENFDNILTVLATYLRISGFICYQILQICNELLRIMYAFQLNNPKRYFEASVQQDYLQKLSEFNTQLEIEQANVWKTGIEFEVTIMKIMIMNSQTNSTEGTDLLIDFFKEAGKSIVSFSPTEDLLSTIVNGGRYLLNKGIEQTMYPKETYQTYYLFQLIKWSIIRQLKSKQSVYKQIQQLKDVFQQYILTSNNWILHFCWIQMIFDIIAYRPIIDKSIILKKQKNQSLNKWNLLIENDLIHCVSYDKNQAIITFFQNQSSQVHDFEATDLLELYGKKKFLLFSQFLLKGELTHNINHWEFYKNFQFKNQSKKSQQDYEIILANYEQEVLQKLFNNLKSQKDELISVNQQIIQSFQNYFKQDSYISIQIIQDDQKVSLKQFLEIYKKLILLSNYILELSLFEAAKINMLTPYLNQITIQKNKSVLLDYQAKINDFVKIYLIEFIDQLLNLFFNVIEFASQIYEASLFLAMKNEVDLDKIMNLFEINYFQDFFFTFDKNFVQFTLSLNFFKQHFSKYLSKEEKIEKAIPLQVTNIWEIIEYNCKGQWINKVIGRLKNVFDSKFNLFNQQFITLENAQQVFINCKFCIIILSFLKQFLNVQKHYLKSIRSQLQDFTRQSESSNEQEDQNFKTNIAQILVQQKSKLSTFVNANTEEGEDQNFKVSCKNLVAQIQADFDQIINEFQSQQNLELCDQILKFLAEAQFLILQVQKDPEELSTLENLQTKYDQVLDAVNNFNNNNNEKKLEVYEQRDESLQFFAQINNHNEQMLTLIKQSNNYFKSYKKLLQLGLSLIHQQKQIQKQKQTKIQQIILQEQSNEEQNKLKDQLVQLQNQEQQNINASINNLKEKSEKFFNLKVISQINQLNAKFSIENQQIEWRLIVNLKLSEFLAFFNLKSNQEYSKGLKPDEVNACIWQEMKNTYDEIKEKIFDSIKFNLDNKVREGLVYNLIRLQQSIQEQQISSFSTKQIQHMWVFEKDQKVRNLLKNKELVQIQKQLFSQDLDNLSGSLKDELKERMQKLENLQQQIKLEGNSQKREKLQLKLKQQYEELDESLDNISELSDAMDISLLFLKDISKDVKQIKNQIDNLQESLNQVGDDIRKLRGKRYDELLEIRKQKILLQSRLAEVDSVYVQLKTIEYDPVTGEIIKSKDGITITNLMSEQWNDFTGEVNEFIWDESKSNDVMLLSGNAGSGKSKAARKIEEFLWKQREINSKWIPIFVSLPTLKNPKYNLFEQALESDNYQFDKYQLREFKDAIQNKKEFIILILDSYDEMKQDCIQQNLIMTNKLIQELNIDKVNRQMKVIITTRKEILNVSGYQTWFYGESLIKLKEVQLQNFNEQQQMEYLNQYVELSVKRKIKEVYEFVKSISGQSFDLKEFLTIWGLISQQVIVCINKSFSRNQDRIFQNKEEDVVIDRLKTHKSLEILKEEQTTGLRKELLALWSANKFRTAIESIKIQDLLTTPFMLEIIVQVLPNMAKRYSGSTQIKDIFIKNFMNLQKQIKLSQNAQEFYRKENQPSVGNEQKDISKLDDEQTSEKEKDEELELKIQRAKVDEIVDKLENQKFFQNYSIVSTLHRDADNIVFDGNTVKLSSEVTNSVIIALKMKKFTVFEFYEGFINFYHEQQIQKQRELGKVSNYESFSCDIFQFSYSLAIDMTLRELSQIGYKPQGRLDLKSNYKIEQVIDDWLNQYFDMEDDYKKLIRSCILLSAKGTTFSFTHKSIQEFYVAKYIFDLLTSLDNFDVNIQEERKVELSKNQKILIKSVFNDPLFNISTDNFRGVINFIKEKLINVQNMNLQLIEIVKLSRNKVYCRAASNSMYLLSQMNVYLGSQDFNRIELENTNISGLSLFDCDLSQSIFKNVEINSCNLNFANLSNAQWLNVICKEKPFLKGYNSGVLEVQFSPDGQYIASVGTENQIKLWNAETYRFIQDLEGHTAKINTLYFSSDSSILFSGSDDRTIRKWNIKNPLKSEIVDEMKNKVIKVQISQDSKRLYSQDGDGNFQILDLLKDGQSEECIFNLNNALITQFALHPTEPMVAVIKQNKQVDLINYITNDQTSLEPVIDSNQIRIMDFTFSHDGIYFAITTSSKAIVWNIQENTKKELIIINFNQNIKVYSIIFGQDNKQIIFGAQEFLFSRELIQNENQSQIEKDQCFEIQLSPQGNIAAVVYEKKLNIIEPTSGSQVNSINFDLQPNQLQFSKDGFKLAFFLKAEQVVKQFIILEVSTLKTICLIFWDSNYWISYILSNNFEKLYISYDNSSKVLINNLKQDQKLKPSFQRILKLNTQKIQKELEIRKFSLSVDHFYVKPQSWIVAYVTSENQSIKIYDLDKNQQIQESLENQKKEVKAVQFSSTKNELAVGYQDELLFWNLDSKPFNVQKRINFGDLIIKSINYSRDGSQFVLVFQSQFKIYDVEHNLLRVEESKEEAYVSFSQDNNFIGFCLNHNQNIVVQNKNQNYGQTLLKGHRNDKIKFMFTHDQKSIISGSPGELILWDLNTFQIIEKKNTYLKDFEQITFSENTDLVALFQRNVVELWKRSDITLKFIGSQVFEFPIKQFSFINDDKQIIMLNANSELLVCNLDCFQLEQTFEQKFDCGAISSNDMIALSQNLEVNIFSNEFEECNFSFKVSQNTKSLKFLNAKQNVLLQCDDQMIKIWDCEKGQQISGIKINEKAMPQLYLQNEILILQGENYVRIWKLSDLHNIKLCGYHEGISSFSIQEDEQLGAGIKDGQYINIKDIFNILFAFPINQDQYIKQLLMSIKSQFLIILSYSRKLSLLQLDTKEMVPFNGDVNAVALCQENNFIIVQAESKILLIEYSNGSLNIIDTFDLQNKISDCFIKFTNSGYDFSLSSYYMIRIFSITKNQKIICKGMQYQLEKNYAIKDPYIKQAQIFQRQGVSNKQLLLAILDQEKKTFRIIDTQKSKQIVLIRSKLYYNCFQLSFDEELICFVNDYVQMSILENNNFVIKQIENLKIEGFSRSYLKAVGKDSFVFVNNKNQIMLFSTSQSSKTLIGTTKKDINCMTYLPYQEWLAISTEENNIMFWDVKAKKIVGTLKGHQKKINAISVSQDGSILASASDDKLIRLWNIKQNESSEAQIAHQYSISALAISQDGFLLASGSIKGGDAEVPIIMWDLKEKRLITQLKGHKDSITSLQFSYCSRYLISGCIDGTIIFWNIEYPQATKMLYIIDEFNFPINSLSFSPKEQLFASFSKVDNLQQWNFKQIGQYEKDKPIILNTNLKQYCFYQQNEFIYIQQNKDQMTILNVETKKKQVLEQNSKVTQIIPSQDGRLILCLEGQGLLYIWSKDKDNNWFKKWVYLSESKYILLSPNNQFLFQAKDCTTQEQPLFSDAVSNNFRTLLHDFSKLQSVEQKTNQKFDSSEQREIAFSIDLAQTAILKSQEVQIFDTINWQCIYEFKGSQNFKSPQISRDNKYLACYQDIQQISKEKYDNVITLWEINNPAIKKQLEVKDNKLKIYQFSAQDSNRILALYTDGSVREWNVTTQLHKTIVTLPETVKIDLVLFSINLKFLMFQSQSNSQLELWNFQANESSSLSIEEEFSLIACSENENIIAVAIRKGVKVFKGKQVSMINVFDDLNLYNVSFIQFSHDDKQLLFCHDCTIYLYQLEETLTSRILGCWNVQSLILSCAFNSRKQEIALKLSNQVYVLKLYPTIHKNELQGIENQNCTCFSPDSKYLASLTPSLQILELQNLQMIHNFEDFTGEIIQFQSSEILVIANRNKLQFLRINKIEKIVKIKEIKFYNKIIDMAIYSNNLLIQVKDDFNKIKVVFNNIDKFVENLSKAVYNSKGKPFFSGNGNYFALSNENIIEIMNIKNIKQEKCIQLNRQINQGQIFYSNDGNLIVVIFDQTIQLFDSISFKKVKEIKLDFQVSQSEFSLNQKFLGLMCSTSVQIYAFYDQKDLVQFWTIKGEKNYISSIALSPKGDFLLTGGQNQVDFINSIALWKVQQSQQICLNDKINDEVKILKFCPDGINFVAGLSDGSVNLYSIDANQTNFVKKQCFEQLKLNEDITKLQIFCYKSFAKQSLLTAQQSILSKSSINSENKSIIELFLQKGACQ
ncbi:unnamed protein product (macronuclear) [Paramecium tetraurelia]|uniref:NACHT domain-containing protein n=1 Tax=Paramecium tetraurelia TaxID=5888 RepID=A0CUR1_PARTE|nr:uncharacterized protein GSPATT00010729001 [Paramecium tetraurelia]CAK74528.1 unnamed protein product [Paramecium tetraurelia]|eukprot:XP_001441925.1 hypothetical protein (macronuclear) [Paramecium tetraurelia strain d4-2]